MRNDSYSPASETLQNKTPPADTDALIREADHRIANSLTALSGLVRMQAAELAHRTQTLSGQEVGRILGEVSGRVDALGRLHRLLSRHSRTAEIDVSQHLKAVAGAISDALPGVVLKTHWGPGCNISEQQVQPLALIVSEIITNSAKHAHPSGLPVHIDVRCRKEAGGVVIEIADDGVGLPENFDTARDGNLGWRVIRALIKQLDADLVIDSGPLGLRFRLTLPV